MALFFLGGVHGAGKSSVASALATRLPARALSASALIRQEGVEPSTSDKRVNDIAGNQERLLRALSRYREPGTAIILDGHYCLRAESGEPVALTVDVFRRLCPDALLLLEDDPDAIAERLGERDRQHHEASNIAALTLCERAVAELVSATLCLPLLIVRQPEAAEEALSFLTARLS